MQENPETATGRFTLLLQDEHLRLAGPRERHVAGLPRHSLSALLAWQECENQMTSSGNSRPSLLVSLAPLNVSGFTRHSCHPWKTLAQRRLRHAAEQQKKTPVPLLLLAERTTALSLQKL